MKTESEDIDDIPGEYICDFCGVGWDFLWALNDGMWGVCTTCMDAIHAEGEEE